MLVAELVDTIWATRKSDALSGVKFLLAKVVGGSVRVRLWLLLI